MDGVTKGTPMRWGRVFAVLSLVSVPVMLVVNISYLSDWQRGGSAHPLLLSVAILLGSISQVLSVRDDWRGQHTFPDARNKVQLGLALVAFALLVAYSVT